VKVFKSWKWVPVIAVALPAAVFLAAALLVPRYDPGEATGDDLNIRLAAVWHADYDDLYDAAGRPAGTTLGAPWDFMVPEGTLERGFIFDGPPEDLAITWYRAVIRPAGSPQRLFITPSGAVKTAYRSQPFATAILPASYERIVPFDWQVLKHVRWPWTKRVPVEKVDVTLEYWRGPPGPALLVFEGPFTPGKYYESSCGKGTIALRPYYRVSGDWGTEIDFSSNVPGAEAMPVLAYTADVVRHPASQARPLSAKNGQACLVSGAAPAEIVLVTVGERLRRREFHNISVTYPDRPDLEYPVWMNRVAEILDRDPAESRDFYVSDLETAARLAPVVRCEGIRQLHWCMRSFMWGNEGRERMAALTQEERRALLDAARSWSQARDARIRCAGICLGLHMDFERYVDRALEGLREGDLNTRTHIAQALRQHAHDLSAAHIERIKDLLLSSEPWANMTTLLSCLDESKLPAAAEALADLAGNEGSVFWRRGLRKPGVVALLGPRESWPPLLEARYVAANGLDLGITDEGRRRQIGACLAGMLNDRQRIAECTGFNAAADCLTRLLEPEEATELFVDCLMNSREYAWSPLGIARIVRYINRFNGVDIGGLGTDPDAPLALEHGRNWRQVRDDVLAWRKTGVDPGAALRGARAMAGDFRIVWFNSEKPEDSIAGLWPAAAAVEYATRSLVVESVGHALAFSVTSSHPTAKWSCRFVWETERQTIGSVCAFNPASLPIAREMMPGCRIVIENADSPESVLSGTKVFEEWWEKYGPEEGADTGVAARADRE